MPRFKSSEVQRFKNPKKQMFEELETHRFEYSNIEKKNRKIQPVIISTRIPREL